MGKQGASAVMGKRRRRGGLLVNAISASLVAAGCASGPPVAPAGSLPRADAPSPAVESTPESGDDREVPEGPLQKQIAERLKIVAELRELQPKSPVRGEELSGPEMVEHVRGNIDEEVPADVLLATNAFLYLAGVVDESFDYKQSLLDVMGSDLAGFYDPDRKRMYLRTGLDRLERGATLAHELVHALQDQHYDLATLDHWQPDASDRRGALHGLAEGDATSAMLDGMLLGTGRTALDLPEQAIAMQVGALASESSVAGIVLRAVVSPYADGLAFVHALRREGGWGRVDEAWRKPPVSTEQLLHPAKYLAGEPPEEVAVPEPPPGETMRRIYRDVEGEQALRILFEEWFSKQDAEQFASDWAGDRMAVFSAGGRHAFAWLIRYDMEAAARRAMRGMQGWLEHGRGGLRSGQQGTPSSPYCGEHDARGPLAMARRGRDIAVVGGPSGLAKGCAPAAKWLSVLLPQGAPSR